MKLKNIASLHAVVIIVALGVTLISSGVTAQNSEDYNDYWYSDGPTVTFYAENATTGQWIQLKADNPVVYTDTENATIRIHVDGPSYVSNSIIEKDGGIIRWWMGYLTSVSYKAGWQYNKETQVYTNTSNDDQKSLDFELTNIPHYGKHTLEVDASFVVYVFGTQLNPLYFSDYRSYLDFTLAPNPTLTPAPTPTPAQIVFGLNLEQTTIIAAIVTAVAAIAVIFYKRQQATQRLKITSIQ